MKKVGIWFLGVVMVASLVYCGPEQVTPGVDGDPQDSGVVSKVEPAQELGVQAEPALEPAISQEPVVSFEPRPEPPRPEPPVVPDTPSVRDEPPVQDTAPPEPTPEVDTKWLAQVNCMTAPPTGATLAPAPKKYTGGSCPTFQAGMNTFKSSGADRKFILVLPKNIQPNEKLPVLFMWHWLKATATKFLTQGDVQKAVDDQRFIALIPEAKGDINLIVTKVPWPFVTLIPNTRFEEEYVFFDDMLSCVSQQFNVNKECVGSAGVSAGALFTAQLASARSEYLSSFISLSGGTNASAAGVAKVNPWTTTTHKMPALVLWGGPQDSCVLLNFEKASQDLMQNLKKDGHFFLECIHNCKHAEPPITPRQGKSRYESLWDFFLRHPRWLKPGQSPFSVIPWPYSNVPWCGVGQGSATPRTGTCGDPACPI